ncbi:MAG: ComF family protein [Chitinophagales bacterium]|nr:ComF family protein [Hyphomicrobiales bacterium]
MANDYLTDETPLGPARRPRLSAVKRWLASTAHYAADLALPPVCIACRSPLDAHGALCPPCWSGIEFVRPPLCDRLGVPLPFSDGAITISSQALADPPVFARARAATIYTGVMRRLVHALKYEDRHEATRFLARLMADAGRELLRDADALIPIPLSRTRLRTRRFNQSAELARRLSRISGVTFEPLALTRTRDTASQVGLTLDRRRANVAGAFAVPPRWRSRVEGRSIVLVEDVSTAGSTANAGAAALLTAGASRVDVLALALVSGSPNFYDR